MNNSKETQRYMLDPESGNMCLLFTPKDLDKDSHLLPPEIRIPLELGLEVQVLDSREFEYFAPKSTSDEEILEIERQLEEEFKKYKEGISSLKPY